MRIRTSSVLPLAMGTVAAAALIAPASPAASAAEAYPADTCRVGYVWRGAQPTDHVCVTPSVRSQAAFDNLRSVQFARTSGSVCVPGYVTRQAFPGDSTCVTPTTRAAAAADNSEAPWRLAWAIPYTYWKSSDNCGSGCTDNSGIIPRFGVRGYLHNPGATIRIVAKRDGEQRYAIDKTLIAKVVAGKPGGSFDLRTEIGRCGRATAPTNGYVRVYEAGIGWSPRVPIRLPHCYYL